MQMTDYILDNIMYDLKEDFPAQLCSWLLTRFGHEPYDGFFDYTDLRHAARCACRQYIAGTLDFSPSAALSGRIRDFEDAIENLWYDIRYLTEKSERLERENQNLKNALYHTGRSPSTVRSLLQGNDNI